MTRTRLAVAVAILSLAPSARAGDDTAPAPAAPAAAAKHENKISPEAKAAFEKMSKISNDPVAHGLKDASGKITADMMGMALVMNFTFKAPTTVKVEIDPSADEMMKQMGSQMARGMERSLGAMLGIFRPSDDEEYDASIAKVDGKEVVTLTTYKDGVEQGHSDLTLDANGLPASGVFKSKMEMNGQKQEMKNETTFTWAKPGDLYRLEKIEAGMAGGGPGGGMGGGKVTITFTYTDIEKFALATSWKTELPGGQMVFESRVSDLTVNGNKVEIKAAEPAKKGVKKMGEEEDDEEDEGGEKHEGGEKK